MIYAIVIVFLAGLGMGGYGAYDWMDGRAKAHEADLAEAQAKVDELAHEVSTTAAKGIENERIAYMEGEANAQTITRTVYVKGQTYVANTPVLRNPVCTVPADGMFILAAARSGTLTPADAARIDAAVRGTGTLAGRADGDPVPANDPGRGTVPNVQPQTSGPVGGGQVSGTGQGRVHPRPVPIR